MLLCRQQNWAKIELKVAATTVRACTCAGVLLAQSLASSARGPRGSHAGCSMPRTLCRTPRSCCCGQVGVSERLRAQRSRDKAPQPSVAVPRARSKCPPARSRAATGDCTIALYGGRTHTAAGSPHRALFTPLLVDLTVGCSRHAVVAAAAAAHGTHRHRFGTTSRGRCGLSPMCKMQGTTGAARRAHAAITAA